MPYQKVHQRMKLNAFSVSPLMRNMAMSAGAKMPDLGSIVKAAGVFEVDFDTALSDCVGGDGETKNLLGVPCAFSPRTTMLTSSTETA